MMTMPANFIVSINTGNYVDCLLTPQLISGFNKACPKGIMQTVKSIVSMLKEDNGN